MDRLSDLFERSEISISHLSLMATCIHIQAIWTQKRLKIVGSYLDPDCLKL